MASSSEYEIDLEEAKKLLIADGYKEEEDPEYLEAALILFGSAIVGPNIVRVAKWAEMPRKKVAEYSKRLRKSGIWDGHKLSVDWLDEEEGGMAFLLDVMVALGMIERSARDGDEQEPADKAVPHEGGETADG
jgi:hypothetical protein